MVMWVQKGSLTSYGLALHSPNTRSSLCVIPSLLKQKSLTWNAFVRGCSNDLWNLRSSRCPYFALHYVPSRHISHSIFYLKQLRKSTTKEPSVWSGWAHRSSRLDPTCAVQQYHPAALRQLRVCRWVSTHYSDPQVSRLRKDRWWVSCSVHICVLRIVFLCVLLLLFRNKYEKKVTV